MPTKFRAIVSIEFDSEDLQTFAENLGIDEMDASDAITGELDGFGLGVAYLEQFYRNGQPTVHRLTGDGIEITINDHDLDGTEDEEDDDFLHCGGDEEDDD
jgi:hypothetical protein